MIKKIVIEIIYILLIFMVATITTGIPIGFSSLFSSKIFDLSIIDSYFVMSASQLTFYLFLIIGFVAYLIRAISQQFKKEISTVVLLLFTAGIFSVTWFTLNSMN